MKNEALINFLVTAKRNTYAIINDITKIIMEDGGTEVNYQEGLFFYRDRYYGGEPFIGEEVVICDNTIIWGMNLRGKVINPIIPVEEVYAFIREALKNITSDAPFRGPARFQINDLHYSSKAYGTPEHFHGMEKVFINDQLIYECFYHGGCIGKK
jgi:hypothetical protein